MVFVKRRSIFNSKTKYFERVTSVNVVIPLSSLPYLSLDFNKSKLLIIIVPKTAWWVDNSKDTDQTFCGVWTGSAPRNMLLRNLIIERDLPRKKATWCLNVITSIKTSLSMQTKVSVGTSVFRDIAYGICCNNQKDRQYVLWYSMANSSVCLNSLEAHQTIKKHIYCDNSPFPTQSVIQRILKLLTPDIYH